MRKCKHIDIFSNHRSHLSMNSVFNTILVLCTLYAYMHTCYYIIPKQAWAVRSDQGISPLTRRLTTLHIHIHTQWYNTTLYVHVYTYKNIIYNIIYITLYHNISILFVYIIAMFICTTT